MRWAALVLVARVAAASPFEPPSAIAPAQEKYLHAKKLFADKQYAEAADEFAAAYQLDPDSKFLLFNVGLARRMAGACKEAIAAYQAFLDAQPPDAFATNARSGIQKCESQLPPPEPVVTPPPPVVDQPKQEPPKQEPPKPSIDLVKTHVTDTPWYGDRLGAGLVGGGGAMLLAGGVVYLVARQAASNTFSAKTQPDFESARSAARAEEIGSAIAAGVGAALVIAGTIRYATHPRIIIVPSGASVALERAF